jgi:hypothetical protein
MKLPQNDCKEARTKNPKRAWERVQLQHGRFGALVIALAGVGLIEMRQRLNGAGCTEHVAIYFSSQVRDLILKKATVVAGKTLLNNLHDIFDGCPHTSGQRRGGLRSKWATGRLATDGDAKANVRTTSGRQNTDTAALWSFRFLLFVWRGDDLPKRLMISLTETAPLGLVPLCSLDFQSQYLAPALRKYVAELMGEDAEEGAEDSDEPETAAVKDVVAHNVGPDAAMEIAIARSTVEQC